MRRLPKNILFFGVGLSLIIPKVFACGLEWAVPVTHFDGVEEHGYVCVSEKIGEVDFGDDLKLPLIINFRSDRNTSSPYLGKGWILALLDSNFVQFDENTFYMTQPDGWINRFQRDPKNPTLLGGSGGWKAEIKGDIVTAWASCGWKIIFNKGKIASLFTPKNRRLDFVYDGNKIAEIREGGAKKLSVEFKANTGEVSAIIANNKKICIELAQRPRLETIASQNVISGMDNSLNKLITIDGKLTRYDFSVNEKINPTIRISSKSADRLISWDRNTRRISSDGKWLYFIKPGKDLGNASTYRISGSDVSEYWFANTENGDDTTLKDGFWVTTKYFTSGVLHGRIRTKSTVSSTGSKREIISYNYNEKGELFRVLSSNKELIVNQASKMLIQKIKSRTTWEVPLTVDGSISQIN